MGTETGSSWAGRETRKSPDSYVSVVLWNTTGSQRESGTLGQQKTEEIS